MATTARTIIQRVGTTPKGKHTGHRIIVPSKLAQILGPVGTPVVVTAYADRLVIRAEEPGEMKNGYKEEGKREEQSERSDEAGGG